MTLVDLSQFQNIIIEIRSQKVILDSDLAGLYGVSTKRLNEQVRRNINRFPEEFMFRLTKQEKNKVVAICDHLKKLKFSHVNPYVFTEHGTLMAATVLNSDLAMQTSIQIIKSFVRMRRLITNDLKMSKKILQIESQLGMHDKKLEQIIETIKKLIVLNGDKNTKPIGFHVNMDES